MLRRLVVIIFIVLFISPLVSATRPDYSFSSDVFDNLPPYPDDLLEIRDLFAQNRINVTQLSSQYYLQPEFYPGWFGVCNNFYNSNKTYYGVYGFNIYPSLITMFVEEGDIVPVEALLSNGFGIPTKTGCSINVSYNSSIISVDVIEPTESFLLSQTYPCFLPDWVIPLKLKVTILKNQSTSIEVFNSKPSASIHEVWQQLYGDSYSTIDAFRSKTPELQIKFIMPEPEFKYSEDPTLSLYSIEHYFVPLLIIVAIIIGVIISCIIVKRNGGHS